MICLHYMPLLFPTVILSFLPSLAIPPTYWRREGWVLGDLALGLCPLLKSAASSDVPCRSRTLWSCTALARRRGRLISSCRGRRCGSRRCWGVSARGREGALGAAVPAFWALPVVSPAMILLFRFLYPCVHLWRWGSRVPVGERFCPSRFPLPPLVARSLEPLGMINLVSYGKIPANILEYPND